MIKTTRFKLSEEIIEEEDLQYLEYTATQNENDKTLVTWMDSGKFHKAEYENVDVEIYFERKDWIEII